MLNRPPLIGQWHHGDGVLVCGTVRVATADFDTEPSEQFKAQMFDWMCEALNAPIVKQEGGSANAFLKQLERIGLRVQGVEELREQLMLATDWREAMTMAAQAGRKNGIVLFFAEPDVPTAEVMLRMVEVLDDFGFSCDDRRAIISNTRVAAS